MASHFKRMMKMETRIDARPKDLIDPVTGIFKIVLAGAVGEGLAIGGHVHARRSEKLATNDDTAPVMQPCAAGYSGCAGVVPQGLSTPGKS
jgi:hypothetical protein